MDNTTLIKPTLRVLKEDQKHRIHKDAMNILSSVGIRVESHQARAIYQKAVGLKTIGDDTVKIPSEIVEAALKKVPPSLDIYNRKGEKCMCLPGEARFGLSYLLNLACGEMMAFYQIPHYGNSGNAVGWGGDIIAAGHQWMNHVLSCLGTTGMAVFVGTVLGSKVFSPKLAVYANLPVPHGTLARLIRPDPASR